MIHYFTCTHLWEACAEARRLGEAMIAMIAFVPWNVTPSGMAYKAIYDEMQPGSTDARSHAHHRKGNESACTPHHARS